jgi:glycosyltransferase involved in cell wall biosynthesis
MTPPGQSPRVAIFRSELLPRSETFIKTQALALRRWHPILAGNRRVLDGLPLGEVDVRVSGSYAPQHRALLRTCQLVGLPHRPTHRLLASLDADLIHVHFGTDATDLWPSIRVLGKPVLVTLHGYDINIHREWWEAGHGGLARRSYPKRLLALSRIPNVRFVAVSEAVRARAVAFGLPQDTITTCHIGVDTAAFAPVVDTQFRRKRVLFIGRLVKNKGVDVLIRAFAMVHAKVPDAELIVVGDGPLRDDLERQAATDSIPVRFLGAMSHDRVKNELASARLLCQPSVTIASGASEGFGLVILEAQACGVPVITSARGGSTEGIIEGVTGFRFAEGDALAAATAMTTLLTDDATLSSMSSNARKFVIERYRLDDCTARLEDIYDEHMLFCQAQLTARGATQ